MTHYAWTIGHPTIPVHQWEFFATKKEATEAFNKRFPKNMKGIRSILKISDVKVRKVKVEIL